jgi:hypothetical protein
VVDDIPHVESVQRQLSDLVEDANAGRLAQHQVPDEPED